MTQELAIKTTSPAKLNEATAIAHAAAQFLTKAARANLEAKPDDSHSNLGWDSASRCFKSQPLPGANGDVFIALSVAKLELSLIDSGTGTSTYLLSGHSQAEASEWLDDALASVALQPCSGVSLPYELPPEALAIGTFTKTPPEGLLALSAWFDLANTTLGKLVVENASLKPGPSAVRCWPHHFDIATYVGLEDGDAETAKGIGVGMSPGDESYGQPYFYVNPWPHLDADSLPAPPVPGHWHTDGFVGAIVTGDELLSTEDTEAALSSFLERAFGIGHIMLMK